MTVTGFERGLLEELHGTAREAVQNSSTAYATSERLVRLGARVVLMRLLQTTTNIVDGQVTYSFVVLADTVRAMQRELDR